MIKHYYLVGHEWLEDTETGESVHWPEGGKVNPEDFFLVDELWNRLLEQDEKEEKAD